MLGFPVLSRLHSKHAQSTQYGYDQPRQLLAEIAQQFPNRAVIFVRAGLLPERCQIDEILSLTNPLAAFTVLSNADANVNPFCGLKHHIHTDGQPLTTGHASHLVRLLAPGQLHGISHWSDHFALLPAATVSALLQASGAGDFMQQLRAIDGQLLLDDHLFVPDPTAALFEPTQLASHESISPPPFGLLSTRLQQWMDCNHGNPDASRDNLPATLHITHSWGGGVAQWLSSFISNDIDHQHYQLRSENARSGHGYAQKLSLYRGNQLDCPIASWWLQPAIQSIDICNADYQQIVAEICRRYRISRVFVSSLVGHSLDALNTGLPTLQVLHDHFPVWPLLSVSPEAYLRDAESADLDTALQAHQRQLEFTDKNAATWIQVRDAYLKLLKQNQVQLAAPGDSVLRMQNRIIPAFADLAVSIIPHAFPAMPSEQPVLPKPRRDGRLRMVILGRMQAGKGQQLLLDALAELGEYVQVYLLGTGKSGEQFFGMPGVDVVLEYQRGELNELLGTIGPDFAALLSLVPETFSFTLSELQAMQIPVIATKVGSFNDRIKHADNGWLIDANAEALVSQVADLCARPEQIEQVRERLGHAETDTPFGSATQMVAAYNRQCPGRALENSFEPASVDLETVQSAAAAFEQTQALNELSRSNEKSRALSKEVEQRTEWAQSISQQLKREEARREKWVALLETEIDRLKMMVETSQLELEEKKTHLQQTSSELQHLADQHAQVLGSLSWRITRPMRVGRRALKNFMLARAWNPARWPWLISQTIKNLSTHGLKGTIQRIQYTGAEPPPQPQSTDQLESVGDPKPPQAFPIHAQADVSIVIPVYNKWTYTAACLRSLIETQSSFSYEVIVVDDQSSDETAGYLESIKGIKYLRNDENLGFVGSCNRGASVASGEYIVMLNNDTQVLDGWLDELIETFSREPKAGLVGARLVYPDGRLQESGGIIFSDGSGWNYGREQDAEAPDYLFLREVDYCSGACIALKTELFASLGGFDDRYAPAYYEDTDLAFRVREAGLKVLIQPMSAVIHFEGVTSGTDTSTGVKKYQLINQQKFLQRWKDELPSQPQPVNGVDDLKAVRAASDHRLKGRILFIDATTPQPDKDSGSVRLTNLMQCCRDLGYGITFFADNRDYDGKYTRDLQRNGIEVLYHPWLESLSDFFRNRGAEFDYVFVSRHYIATNYISLIKRYCPQAKFIFDTVDLHYLREQRHAELENSLPLKRTAQQTRRAELNVIKAADATVVVSTVEEEVLKTDAPDAKVHVLSNIHHVPGRDKGFKERRDVYFVGGYQHPPNVDAACWFVNDIWPLIHAELPQVKFHLIGSNAPPAIRALSGDGVTVHGFVESLDEYLNGCKLAVAPLRYGAGVKGKVNMSMAHGQPVVATPAAVEGMFAEHERELLVAEDAPAFAREVVRLYQDEALWNQCSDASVENVETHFSLSAARSSLLKLLKPDDS